MDISIFSDVICPWCYVGKRRLERALGEARSGEVAIEWLPFELNPDMPPEGMPRAAYRAQKFGPERAAVLDAQMRAVGAEEGIRFAFDRQARTPNTRRAHMLIAHASVEGRGPEVVEALFRAYFEEALDIGDDAVLAGIAGRAGVTGWPAQQNNEDVREKEERVRDLGISGVPTFIFNKESGLSGAYPPEQLAQAIKEAAR